ncbi:hypothetical protein ETAA8_14820 [Anatilimnocola aggregata]|uniref:Uncharacterized protein n=1 Tax=Anatilimnocola aggregata TaxID=2528021 RepID=A0A517Y831_9BACT|nr:hypothetical protein [Anatilimnocola aggregata]QDU26404.1 hypothetical protein ETAA8_14820 [Anatilimnocola aggregata]
MSISPTERTCPICGSSDLKLLETKPMLHGEDIVAAVKNPRVLGTNLVYQCGCGAGFTLSAPQASAQAPRQTEYLRQTEK